MGLNMAALKILSQYPSKRVLSLGYPDIVATAADVRRIFHVTPTRFSDAGAWHNVDHSLPDTLELFSAIGSELTCIDMHASRGCERIVDLNYPHDLGRFGMVIDPGTIEHCFNIGQAIINAAQAVAVGGVIFHGVPISMVNHGFYNLCPTLLRDFYMQNDWHIELLRGIAKDGYEFDLSADKRVTVPSECSMFCVARRRTDAPMKYPTQSKYLKYPDLRVKAA